MGDFLADIDDMSSAAPNLGRVVQIEDLVDAGIDRQDYVSRGQRLIEEEPRRAVSNI